MTLDQPSSPARPVRAKEGYAFYYNSLGTPLHILSVGPKTPDKYGILLHSSPLKTCCGPAKKFERYPDGYITSWECTDVTTEDALCKHCLKSDNWEYVDETEKQR